MAAAVPMLLQFQQLCLGGDAAAGRKGHPGHLCCQLTVQGKIRALHRAVTGNVGVDDGGAAGL